MRTRRRVTLAYSDDPYDPAQQMKRATAQRNTASGDHTSIATQTGGTGIYCRRAPPDPNGM